MWENIDIIHTVRKLFAFLSFNALKKSFREMLKLKRGVYVNILQKQLFQHVET